MNDQENITLDSLLQKIEFPGADEENMKAFLSDETFTQGILQQIEDITHHTKEPIIWSGIALLNLLLILFFGINGLISETFINDLSVVHVQFIFFFLALALAGSLIGIVISLDTSKVHSWLSERIFHGGMGRH